MRLLIVLVLLTMSTGCVVVTRPTSGPVSAPTVARYYYLYYPDHEVYYDTRRRIYFYNERGRWLSVTRLPSHIHLNDHHVQIVMTNNRPYVKHRVHLSSYPPRPRVNQIIVERYTYRYYPDNEVYFDPKNHIYYYQKGTRWHKTRRLPWTLRSKLGRWQEFDSGEKLPYIKHREHARRFPPRHAQQVKHYRRYHYYPDSQVYYDPDSRKYYYQQRGKWRQSKRLPSHIHLNDHHVSVESKHNTPYRDFSEHRRNYPKQQPSRYQRNRPYNQQAHNQDQYDEDDFTPRGNRQKDEYRREQDNRGRRENWRNDQNDDRSRYDHQANRDNRPENPAIRSGVKPNQRFDRRQPPPKQQLSEADNRRGSGPAIRNNAPPPAKGPSSLLPAQQLVKRQQQRSKKQSSGGKHHYLYFPNNQVYYDTQRRLYFVQRGKQWRSMKVLPKSFKVDRNQQVSIQLDTDKPYTHHQKLLSEYPPNAQKSRDKGGKNR